MEIALIKPTRVPHHLGQQITGRTRFNSLFRVHSFLSQKQYLDHGYAPLDYHGWTISPHLGLTLVHMTEEPTINLVLLLHTCRHAK